MARWRAPLTEYWNQELLEKVDVIDMLEVGAKVRNLQQSGDEANFSCPFPGHTHGDQTPSAYMNVMSRLWYCHGCHKSGDAITFLAELEGVSIMQVVQWYEERYGGGFQEPKGSVLDEIKRRAQPAQQKETERRDPELNEGLLLGTLARWSELAAADDRPEWASYLLGRGFSPATLQLHEVGYDPVSDRIVLPVRDRLGRFVGFKARSYRKGHEPRYVLLGDTLRTGTVYGFAPYRPGDHLYGLHRTMGGHLVVCEGELNAIALRQVGYEAVAPAGSTVSAEQVQLIRDNADRVTLVFDCDDAGSHALDGWEDKAGKHHPGLVERLEPFMPVQVAPAHVEDPARMLQEGREDLMHDLILGARSPIENLIRGVTSP